MLRHVIVLAGILAITASHFAEAKRPPVKKRAQARAARVSSGPPGSKDIMIAMDRADIRYDDAVSTDTPGVTGYPSPYGGIGFYMARAVGSPDCRELKPNLYTCSFDREIAYKAAQDSIWGSLQVMALSMQLEKVARRTHTFQKRGSYWESPSYEQFNIDWKRRQAANGANDASAQRKRDDDFKERQRKFSDCQSRSPFETCYF